MNRINIDHLTEAELIDLNHRIVVGLVGLQGMRDSSAFRNSPICQMRILTISCSRLAKVDGRRLVMKVRNPNSSHNRAPFHQLRIAGEE